MAKIGAGLLLAGVGLFFLLGSKSYLANAQVNNGTPDYKVKWTATKFIVLDFDSLFYPTGHAGFNPDPATSGAKTRLAIGPAEWQVVYSQRTCAQNIPSCFKDIYTETWSTAPLNADDNCYKVAENCQPGGKYAGDWIWSLSGHLPNSLLSAYGKISVVTAAVTDKNLYASNYDYFNGNNPVANWYKALGRGPGVLEDYTCVSGNTCNLSFKGFNTGGTVIYTSGAYAWQWGLFTNNIAADTPLAGSYIPAHWFVKGTLL